MRLGIRNRIRLMRKVLTHQIVLTKVKYQIENWFVFVVFVCLRTTNFYQVNDIFVLEELKDSNFSKCGDRKLKSKRIMWKCEIENAELQFTYSFLLVFHQDTFHSNKLVAILCTGFEYFATKEWTWKVERNFEEFRNVLPECSLADFGNFFILDGFIAIRKVI